MNICVLSKQYNPGGGGSERYASALSAALVDRGHEVDVFALGELDVLSTQHKQTDVKISFLNNRIRQLVVFETVYYSILASQSTDFAQYDIIHGTLMPASPIAVAPTLSETPLVLTSHGTSIDEVKSHKLEVPTDYLKKLFFHPVNVLMDIITIPQADRTIAISSDAAKRLKQWYPVTDEKLACVPHGVDITKFHPHQDRHPAPTQDNCSILHVGRLVSRKHIDLVLHALSQIQRSDIELLIAGTGTHRDRLEDLVNKLNIATNVTFLGFVPEDELPSLYASSDMFAFCSRYEGFGLTFLEAMASGTPVIGTPVGGFPDLVTDGESGIIVDRDPTDMAQAIDTLASSPALLEEMSTKAREVAESRTWDTVAAETETLYESVITNS